MFKKLMEKNKAREPKAVENAYSHLVKQGLAKEGYDVDAIQAIQNNYFGEPDNPVYKAEFEAMLAKRKEIKARYKV